MAMHAPTCESLSLKFQAVGLILYRFPSPQTFIKELLERAAKIKPGIAS